MTWGCRVTGPGSAVFSASTELSSSMARAETKEAWDVWLGSGWGGSGGSIGGIGRGRGSVINSPLRT